MNYTEFGKFYRIMRVQHGETISDASKLLDVSTSYISAVELGKKAVPKEWLEKISEHYQLNRDEKEKLQNAINDSKTHVSLDLIGTEKYKRKLALQFQRSFGNVDEKTADKIIKILGGE